MAGALSPQLGGLARCRRRKFPAGREFWEIFSRCPTESRTNFRQTRDRHAASREFFTGSQGIIITPQRIILAWQGI
jgi:hypothetical protein